MIGLINFLWGFVTCLVGLYILDKIDKMNKRLELKKRQEQVNEKFNRMISRQREFDNIEISQEALDCAACFYEWFEEQDQKEKEKGCGHW